MAARCRNHARARRRCSPRPRRVPRPRGLPAPGAHARRHRRHAGGARGHGGLPGLFPGGARGSGRHGRGLVRVLAPLPHPDAVLHL
ncbi:hypothetical protein FDK12_08030 [Arthrobacter sp. NamB2]|nr:hypothetical protein FDK12_08030 [Arthrobacter sp. NamB2]